MASTLHEACLNGARTQRLRDFALPTLSSTFPDAGEAFMSFGVVTSAMSGGVGERPDQSRQLEHHEVRRCPGDLAVSALVETYRLNSRSMHQGPHNRKIPYATRNGNPLRGVRVLDYKTSASPEEGHEEA